MNIQDIKVISVLGGGTMGIGIAQVMAYKGYKVYLRDINKDLVNGALDRIKKNLQKMVELKKITEPEVAEIMTRIIGTTEIQAAVKDADFIVEAIPEKIELKKETYKEVQKFCKADTILASNTSTLSITELAAVTDRPQKYIGMHFMNPVPQMSLVEIVTGLLSSPETIQITKELILKLGKEPIVIKDTPGFATTRLGVALFLEASKMLEEGVASVDDIDKAMRIGYGHRMGPFETCDLVGLDARLNNINALYESTRDLTWKPPQLLKKLVSAGFLGTKPASKGGYYQYFGIIPAKK
jgi:3-hydroxybutyryl-CoA dehydrogenase